MIASADNFIDTRRALVEHRDELAALLSAQTGSEIAQVMGGTVLLYRARKKDPVIVLPTSKGA